MYNEDQNNFLLDTQKEYTFTEERYKELKITHNWVLDSESFGYYDDGTVLEIDPYMMFKEGSNKFLGWECNAGNDSILINPDGSALWANCGIKSYSHFRDLDPIDLKKSIICNRLECSCGTDLRSNKKFISI